jgi:ribosomal protein S18 acetylase RimI-like enzyme
MGGAQARTPAEGVGEATPLLRPATAGQARAAAHLIYAPMGRMADYLFGGDDSACALDVLTKLFAQRENRFSHEFSDVLEVDSQVAGLLLAYPAGLVEGLSIPMARQLREILGVGGMWRLIRRSVPLMRLKEYEADEFYIFTISVLPGWQSHGLGTRLLVRAEERCRAAGLWKCALGVTTDNERAIQFYKRCGYRIVETVHVPRLARAIEYPGYHRMVKEVPETENL